MKLTGLTLQEVQQRRREFGPNQLPSAPRPTVLVLFLRQFRSPLISLLLVAAVISGAIGGHDEALMIGIVLLLNATLGTYQEWRAERGAAALQKLLRTRSRVIRDGQVQQLDAEDLVPGDLVLLESGDRIPADLRLLTCQGFSADESLLTGESLPVSKQTGGEAFAGSLVVRGRAQATVEKIGTQTALGQVAHDMSEVAAGTSPLQVRMHRFSQRVGAVTVGIIGLICFLGIGLHGMSPVETFFAAVALAVSAIPEGLPIALTVALSVAAARMARHGVVVRRLEAVEALGSCTLIASDKTGTLTVNHLTVTEIRIPGQKVYTVEGAGLAPEGRILQQGQPVSTSTLRRLAEVAALCNEADLIYKDGEWIRLGGDPVDGALLSFARKLDLCVEESRQNLPEVHRIPFEPELQYAASIRQDGLRRRVLVKGAPEKVLSFSAEDPAAWLTAAEDMAASGLRVLMLADGITDEAMKSNFVPSNLQPLALVGMLDPLRPEVPEALRDCERAGVRVIMVTGDHPVTALAISRQLGLAAAPDQVVSGKDLKDPHEVIETVRVFARTAPHQKLEIVQAAQARGHFVAVTGDGVNDAPALRAANIGVAMGKHGTDVAREAAALVITDDNFATLVSGIREGRIAYSNVRKVIFLLVSTGLAEVVMVLTTFLTGLPVPLTPSQLLWLNLVTNGIQDVALCFEPGEGNELNHPPRSPHEGVFDRIMLERVFVAVLVMSGIGLLTFTWLLAQGWAVESARNLLLFQFVLLEIVHIGNCRSEHRSLFKIPPLANPLLFVGSLVAFALHMLATWHPLGQRFLHTQPVTVEQFVLLGLLTLPLVVVGELQKWWQGGNRRPILNWG